MSTPASGTAGASSSLPSSPHTGYGGHGGHGSHGHHGSQPASAFTSPISSPPTSAAAASASAASAAAAAAAAAAGGLPSDRAALIRGGRVKYLANIPRYSHDNKVITSQYTWWNFLPKNTLLQFSNRANLYFLIIGIFQMIPAVTTTNGLPTIYSPLALIIFVGAVRAALEDRSRHLADAARNKTKYWRLEPLPARYSGAFSATSPFSTGSGGGGGNNNSNYSYNHNAHTRGAAYGAQGAYATPHSLAIVTNNPQSNAAGDNYQAPALPLSLAITTTPTLTPSQSQAAPPLSLEPLPHPSLSTAVAVDPSTVVVSPSDLFECEGQSSKRRRIQWQSLLTLPGEPPLTGASTANAGGAGGGAGADGGGAAASAESAQRHAIRAKLLHDNQAFEVCNSGDMKIGSIVKVYKNQMIPCDLVLLGSSEPRGQCFVDKANLNGETTLEVMSAPHALRPLIEDRGEGSGDSLRLVDLHVRFEAPNAHFDRFRGTLTVTPRLPLPNSNNNTSAATESLDAFAPGSAPTVIPLSHKHLLLRETVLRNCDFIIGLTVYTSDDTKIRRSIVEGEASPVKTSRVLRLVDRFITIMFAVQILLCLIGGAYAGAWLGNASKHWYLRAERVGEGDALVIGIAATFSWMILLSSMVPISLVVSAQLVKFSNSYLLEWDLRLWSNKLGRGVKCNTSTLHEDLGLVDFVFSDKTGTLTQNKMEFRYAVIAQHNSDNTGGDTSDGELSECESEFEGDGKTFTAVVSKSGSGRAAAAGIVTVGNVTSVAPESAVTPTAVLVSFGSIETEIAKSVRKKMQQQQQLGSGSGSKRAKGGRRAAQSKGVLRSSTTHEFPTLLPPTVSGQGPSNNNPNNNSLPASGSSFFTNTSNARASGASALPAPSSLSSLHSTLSNANLASTSAVSLPKSARGARTVLASTPAVAADLAFAVSDAPPGDRWSTSLYRDMLDDSSLITASAHPRYNTPFMSPFCSVQWNTAQGIFAPLYRKQVREIIFSILPRSMAANLVAAGTVAGKTAEAEAASAEADAQALALANSSNSNSNSLGGGAQFYNNNNNSNLDPVRSNFASTSFTSPSFANASKSKIDMSASVAGAPRFETYNEYSAPPSPALAAVSAAKTGAVGGSAAASTASGASDALRARNRGSVTEMTPGRRQLASSGGSFVGGLTGSASSLGDSEQSRSARYGFSLNIALYSRPFIII